MMRASKEEKQMMMVVVVVMMIRASKEENQLKWEKEVSSPSSSTDSNNHPAFSTASSFSKPARDLSTDLRLGLSLSSSSSIARNQGSDWPPIKQHLRSTLEDKRSHHRHPTTFLV
ncbi:hypothetical protein IHE45_03G065700 [Dioscorea alata]|uniref:Uncharacterized protein n=1 Tax=Dioscorea alata TaxID=55571 RepID=A0ACB7WLH6_DIOAL|nr:hypothetical protein IHE45_03G065700 [Dioscorea alata]